MPDQHKVSPVFSFGEDGEMLPTTKEGGDRTKTLVDFYTDFPRREI